MLRKDDKYIDNLKEIVNSIISLAEEIKESHSQINDRQRMDNVISSSEIYLNAFGNYVAAFNESQISKKNLADNSSAIMKEIENLKSIEVDKMYSSYKKTISAMIVIILAGIFIGIFMAVAVTKNTLRHLGGEPRHMADIAGDVAGGNLIIAFNNKNKIHSSSLYISIKNMVNKLKDVVENVRSISSRHSFRKPADQYICRTGFPGSNRTGIIC